MNKMHNYHTLLTWTGNKGEGTSDYRAYSRNYTVSGEGKPDILASADPVFLGDMEKYNPEELFLASLSACHLLTYLHLCADSGIIVVEYQDRASGVMEQSPDGGGKFTHVSLNPVVYVQDETMMEKANDLHNEANKLCFIANSCNFQINHYPICRVK